MFQHITHMHIPLEFHTYFLIWFFNQQHLCNTHTVPIAKHLKNMGNKTHLSACNYFQVELMLE